jgi:hypothetical protein
MGLLSGPSYINLPFFCTVYSVAFMLASALERLIPRVEPFLTIEKIVAKVDFLPFENQMPPDTLPRDRPSEDFVDAFYYWKGRYLRRFRGFYNTFSAAFVAIIRAPVYFIGPVRIICMIEPAIGSIIRNILVLVGFGPLIDRHTAWFASSNMLDAEFTDTVLEGAFSSVYAFLTSGIVGNQILLPLLNLVTVVVGQSAHFWVLAVPPAMLWVARKVIDKIRMKQQEEFQKEWDNGLRDEYLGGPLYTSPGGEPLQ